MQTRKRGKVAMGFVVFLFSIQFAACLAQDLPPRPELNVMKCEPAPVVDGDLTDACWQKAAALGSFYLWRGNGKASDAQTVKVVRDDEWLYFAFEIKLPFPQAIRSTALNHDGTISADDSVEIMIDPGTSGELYFHYMLTSGNVRGERRCVSQGTSKDTGWNLPWRSATKITPAGWQAEIAVPLKPLAEQGELGNMTLNIFANRIVVMLDKAGARVSETVENTSWSAVRRGFHEPDRFGLLKGVEGLNPKEPLLVSAWDIKIGGYVTDEKGLFSYDISGSVRGFTPREGKVMLVVEDRPGSGKGDTVRREIEIKPDQIIPFTVKMPVKVLAGRTAELSVRDPITDEQFQTVVLRDMASLSLMRTYARYSYYTTEPEFQVVCEVGLPEGELKKAQLVAKDKAGETLVEVKDLRPRTMLPVPAKTLSVGQHPVTVELQRKSGEVMIRQEATLVKRAPKPGCEWKVDRADKVILNNGKPFFPFGIMIDKPTTTNQEVMIKDIADAGFNTVVRFGYDSIDKLEELMAMALKYRLYVVEFPYLWRESSSTNRPPQPDPSLDWLQAIVFKWDWRMNNILLPGARRLMSHPNLMAWYLYDEPQGHRGLAACSLRLHNKLNEMDGYHPTEILYIPPIPEGNEFSDNCDILGIDPYWIPGAGSGDLGNPNRVGGCTWQARQRADRDLKLLSVTPCAEHWSATRMRIYDEREQRVQTYLSLIHGAKNILYFVYPFKHQSTFSTFVRLGKEMAVLGPACLAPEPEQKIECLPVAFDPANNIYPDVQVALKENPAGGYILLAANWRAYPVEITCTLSLLGKFGEVRQVFDKSSVCKVEQGAFVDTLAPMDTRAYAIEGPLELAAPVEISVAMKAQSEKTDAFYTKPAVPRGGLPGRKNILPNSGFEECSIPGVPDYYRDIRTAKTAVGYRLGDPRGDCGWGIDTNRPYEGRNCLRMQGPFMLFSASHKIDKQTKYVFSAWVRGDGGTNTIVGFYAAGADEKRASPLAADWQRISQTITVDPSGENLIGFSVANPSGTNNVWIDAMQLEQGAVLSDYEACERKE